MLANLIMTLANRSPRARGRIFKWTFEALAAMSRDVVSWTFMNYGYEDLDAGASPIRTAISFTPTFTELRKSMMCLPNWKDRDW